MLVFFPHPKKPTGPCFSVLASMSCSGICECSATIAQEIPKTCRHTYACMHACMYNRTYIYIHIYTDAYHTYMHTYMHACMRACIQIIRTILIIHACDKSCICMHKHTCMSSMCTQQRTCLLTRHTLAARGDPPRGGTCAEHRTLHKQQRDGPDARGLPCVASQGTRGASLRG